MARLNTAIDPTPTPGRSSSYRGQTPPSQYIASSRASTYSVISPGPSSNSDKENEPDLGDDSTPRAASKGKQPMAPPRLPTPNSGSSSHSNKRRRLGEYVLDPTPASSIRDSEQPEEQSYNSDQDVDQRRVIRDSEQPEEHFYNPNQNVDERRVVRANIRNNHRAMEDLRDELIKPGDKRLLEHVRRGDEYMKNVRQTADAVLDSRFLVSAGELALKKTYNSVRGDAAVSLDLDEFVSKCITFMRLGGRPTEEADAPTLTQARRNAHRRRTAADEEDEDEEDDGDALDWAVLGSKACFPTNKRPPVPGFLLGPLSVQKKARQTQRRQARSQRETQGPTTRPQELQHADIQKAESSNLTHIVKGIKSVMEKHIETNMAAVEEELPEDAEEEDIRQACRRRRISMDPAQEACVLLADFVINPKSFSQTVENIFYVSFLIKEGRVRVSRDVDGFPALYPAQARSVQEHRDENVSKNQGVLSIDEADWKILIETFGIKEPLIPHRARDASTVTAKGWYG